MRFIQGVLNSVRFTHLRGHSRHVGILLALGFSLLSHAAESPFSPNRWPGVPFTAQLPAYTPGTTHPSTPPGVKFLGADAEAVRYALPPGRWKLEFIGTP